MFYHVGASFCYRGLVVLALDNASLILVTASLQMFTNFVEVYKDTVCVVVFMRETSYVLRLYKHHCICIMSFSERVGTHSFRAPSAVWGYLAQVNEWSRGQMTWKTFFVGGEVHMPVYRAVPVCKLIS